MSGCGFLKAGISKKRTDMAAGFTQSAQLVSFIVAWETTEARQGVKQVLMCMPGGSAARNTNEGGSKDVWKERGPSVSVSITLREVNCCDDRLLKMQWERTLLKIRTSTSIHEY